jgi:hypothetical protein
MVDLVAMAVLVEDLYTLKAPKAKVIQDKDFRVASMGIL